MNSLLAPYGSKIGPDPASINACMIGGILSNNSSGMCCGVAQNAYHTLSSLTFVLPSGTVIDTANEQADRILRTRERALTEGLLRLRDRIGASASLHERIRHKYRLKNTTGYSLNAFIDFERPVDIFQHLLIGSEGTLAFIAETVLDTVPDLQVKYTGLLLFRDIHAACIAIVPLRAAGAAALELMDREALRSVQDQQGSPISLKKLPLGGAGLLVEFQCAKESDRPTLESNAKKAAADLEGLDSSVFTHQTGEQALLWKIRKGMFPSVGAVRRSGTSVILEDVVFPVEKLAGAVRDLRLLFTKHGYENAIIFGHAKDGNLHFVITQSFNEQNEIDRYARLMDDVVALVVERYDGSLKGEHGTGRNMAPFVEAEWGFEATEIMRQLKALADPENLLNPGVIINSDPKAHVSNLKSLPSVEEEVDKCIECGYCEIMCPSRDLTLTPRQRIVVRREMKRIASNAAGTQENAASLDADFPYMALDTCAVDGLCALACPVGIDTGALTKRLRRERHSPLARRAALLSAQNFAWVERTARLMLHAGHVAESLIGARIVSLITRWAGLLSRQRLPAWTADLPQAASTRFPRTDAASAHAVYFPSCVSRTMGFLPNETSDFSLIEVVVTLGRRADSPVFIPRDLQGTCCGVSFSSKGYDQAYQFAVNQAISRFWQWSDRGRLPIVVDTSPCTYSLLTCRPHLSQENKPRFDAMRILDSVAFAHDEFLPRLGVKEKMGHVVLHPVCSLTKLNLTSNLEAIGRACSDTISIPRNSGCCGFAGDRGLLFPELTEAATREQSSELINNKYDGHFSSSRTCELAMTRAVGHIYRSYLYLLEKATRE